MKNITHRILRLSGAQKAFLALSCFLMSASLNAQVFSVVGNGTTYNSSTSYPAPYGNWYWFSRHQMFITAAEMTAAGVPPGANIQAVAFNVFSANGQSGLTNWVVNVYTTVATDPLASGLVTTGQVASNGPTTNFGAATVGWNSYAFTPWTWNGTDNVVVETCHASNTGYTYNASTYWTTNLTGSTIKSYWNYQDGVTACQTTGYGPYNSTTTRPNIRFEWLGAPCVGTPATNTILPLSYSTCPGLPNPTLTTVNNYTNAGIYYQWQSSTVSPVGPFAPVPGATLSAAPVPTIGTTTWFQLIVGCTGGGTVAVPGTSIYVAPPTTDIVPYYEGFEGILGPDRLPNCSWWATNISQTVRTYTNSNTNNRVPRTGNNFMSFALPSTNNYVFSNGIQMEPSVTYSAALHFATEYFGYANWTELSLYISAGQSTTNLIHVASAMPAVSGPYKELGGLFTVPSSGLYNMVIKATSTSGSALYLNIDDLSVTIPCTPASMNQPTLTLSVAGNTSVCQGDLVTLNALGASSYSWNGAGGTGSTYTDTPSNTFTYVVWGTNTLTGCTAMQSQVITVKASPTVFIVASKDAVCPGEQIYLTAYGANDYVWSGGPVAAVYPINPTASGAYTVSGTNANGCSMTVSKNITVLTSPAVGATANDSEICLNEVAVLTATGAVSYNWLSSTNPALLSGGVINVSPNASTTYTVIGTDASGCEAMYTIPVTVEACVGIEKLSGLSSGIKVYPNPAQSAITVENSSVISQVEIVDLTGRVVRSESPANTKTEINISQLASGVYYAKITIGGTTEVIKVVKN